ncbi:MAG: hypothetical protein HY822_00045 [Acidobacteria bacterium]|nr:hypothetical protein [Acidobacteriota bacterium]
MDPAWFLPFGTGAVVALAAAAMLLWRRYRVSPAERERRRRLRVGREGRLADCQVTDVHGGILYYSYSVRGVQYSTAQDVSGLLERLGAEPAVLVGPASVKFLPRNPADSVLLSEEWSGLRLRA